MLSISSAYASKLLTMSNKKTLNFIYLIRQLGRPTPVLILDCQDVTKLTDNKRDKVLMQKMHLAIKNEKEVLSAFFDKSTVKIGDFVVLEEGNHNIHSKECPTPCGNIACDVWGSCMSPEWQGATIKIPEVSVSENRPPEIRNDWQSRLFDHMVSEHNKVLLESELFDIKQCIIKEFYPQTITN